MTAGRHVNTLSQSWCTPHKYVNAIKRFWNGRIDLDPCSNEYSVVKAEIEYRLPEHDGLKESWNYPTVYVNPPYGADRERGTTIKNWLAKCATTHLEYGSEVLALIPFLENGCDTGKGAPMACCMIYWGNNVDGFQNTFLQFGAVIDIRGLKEVPIGEDVIIPALELT